MKYIFVDYDNTIYAHKRVREDIVDSPLDYYYSSGGCLNKPLVDLLREYANDYHVYLLTATPDNLELDAKETYLKQNGIDFFTSFYRVPRHDHAIKSAFIKKFCENNHLSTSDCILIDDDTRWQESCEELGISYFTPTYVTCLGAIPMEN